MEEHLIKELNNLYSIGCLTKEQLELGLLNKENANKIIQIGLNERYGVYNGIK